MKSISAVTVAMGILASTGFAEDLSIDPKQDWPWWRGPTRDNKVTGEAQPVLEFSENQHVIWKTAVPGRGHASPTLVGDKIFLATAIDETQAVVAFDRASGEQLWLTEVNEGQLPPKIHAKNTHASSTVACDGERVFANFYNDKTIHLVALTLDGKKDWEQRVGPFEPKKYEFGYAASPLVYGDTVIVIGDQVNAGFLAAFDRQTGKPVWRTQRPADINYASPTVATIGGQDQILVSGIERIAAYNPLDGKLLWESKGGTAPQTCGTVVWDGDLVFASGGYPKKITAAVRAGTGEVVWENNKKCYEQSMLTKDGYLYAINDNGIAYCWRATDGKEMWAERLKGPISASPVLVGDRIYIVNEVGTHYVIKADPNTFEKLSESQLGDETFATPTIVGDRLYVRTTHVDDDGKRQEMLYCLGK